MSHIEPLRETPENVTLSCADFDAMPEELQVMPAPVRAWS